MRESAISGKGFTVFSLCFLLLRPIGFSSEREKAPMACLWAIALQFNDGNLYISIYTGTGFQSCLCCIFFNQFLKHLNVVDKVKS